jgi:hypothetical protein
LLPSLCAITARGATRRGCLSGVSRGRPGPASLGRSRPQHAVDLALGTAAAAAPLFGRLPSARRCGVVATVVLPDVASAHASLPPYCTAVSCCLARVGRLRFVRPAPQHRRREPGTLSPSSHRRHATDPQQIRRLATSIFQFPAFTGSPYSRQPTDPAAPLAWPHRAPIGALPFRHDF